MTTELAASSRKDLIPAVFSTPIPYLVALVTTFASGRFANYLDDLYTETIFQIKGQPLAITIPLIGFGIALVLWFLTSTRRKLTAPSKWFLVTLALAWFGQVVIMFVHGDPTYHSMWIYVPILGLICIKPPNRKEAWRALEVLMWLFAIMLVSTWFLELVNAIPDYGISQETKIYEASNYWIPLDGLFGFEGRWPGPFGYNSKTGFIGVMLIIFSLSQLRKRNFALLGLGVITVLATDSRGAYVSLFLGLFILATFASDGPFGKIKRIIRVPVALGVASVGILSIYTINPNLTGRFGDDGIWAAFFDLYLRSPAIGVGVAEIAAEPGLVQQFTGAHNAYIQALALSGFIGLSLTLVPLLIATFFAVKSAWQGVAGSLALLVAYFTMSISEVLNEGWISHSIYTFMIILATLSVTQHSSRQNPVASQPDATGIQVVQ